jgi:hypothetical protein
MRQEFLKKKELQKYEKRFKKRIGAFINDDDEILSEDCEDERKKFERMNTHMIK